MIIDVSELDIIPIKIGIEVSFLVNFQFSKTETVWLEKELIGQYVQKHHGAYLFPG